LLRLLFSSGGSYTSSVRDFVVILTVFLGSALAAWFFAWPALRWANGGQEWQGAVAMVWLITCCAAGAYGAFRTIRLYHRHRTTSLGRSQKS
jgi:hypothetical protein